MFGRAYISSISSVDGQAAFLNEDARSDHIAKLRSVSTQRAPGLPQSLPMNRTMRLFHDPTLSELHRRLTDLRAQSAPTEEIKAANRQFRIHRSRTKKAALEKWREEWLDHRYHQTIQSGGTASYDQSINDDRIQAIFRIMPERARLAEMIGLDGLATRDQTLLAVQDLLSLCRKNFEVMYLPGNEPIDQSCPECHMQLSSKARDRPDHIYYCRRNALSQSSTDVNFCFLCYRWFRDACEWEAHCSRHLLSMNSIWCGVQRYCHTVIGPGTCPFCLSDEQMSASKRLQTWTRHYLLIKHVNSHIAKICNPEIQCPHPLCHKQLNSTDLFRQHLSNIHGLTTSQKEAFDAQRSADTKNNDLPSDDNARRRKKRKLNSRSEPTFIAWSPSASSMSQQPSSRSRVSIIDPGSKKRKMAEAKDYTVQASSTALSILEKAPPSDEDTVCDSLYEPCIGLEAKDPIFERVDIPIDPALLSANDTLDLQSSTEVSEKSGTIDMVFCENSSNASPFTMRNTRAKSPSITRSVHDEFVKPSASCKAPGDHAFQCPICNRDVARPPRNRTMNFRQQETFCEDHRRMEAEIEWIECGYPRIAWRRLKARMSKKISTLRHIVIARASSFFRTALQGETVNRKARKSWGVTNMIAGYYGPRGQQLM